MNNLVVRAKRFFPEGGFARSVSVLAGGTALGQGIVVLSSPILTHLYSPSEFGVLTVYMSVLSLLTVMGSLRYEAAIPLPEEKEQAADLLGLCLLLVLGMSIMTGIAVWVLNAQIVKWTHAPMLRPYLWMLPLSLLGAGIYQVLSIWAVRKKAFQQVARTKLAQSIGQVVTQAGLGMLQVGSFGLLAGDVIGRMAGSGRLGRQAWREEGADIRRVSWAGIKRMATRYRRFPLLSGGSVLLNSLGTQMTPLLLTALYGPTHVGLYMLADRMLGMPLSLISNSVSQVYLAEAAQRGHEGVQGVKRLFWKAVKHMFLLGTPLVGLIALLAPTVFSFVFGPSWSESGVYLQLLAPMYLVQFVSTPIGCNLIVMERNGLHLIREIIRSLLVISAMYLAKNLGSEPATAILFFSLAGTLGYLVHIFFSWLSMQGHKNNRVKEANL
jgi:O-antigen/teichoic acid export membrane protein